MDKEKFRKRLQGMGAIGIFVGQEVLKGQETLAYAEIPRGEGEDGDQVYVLTRDKLIWVYARTEDGFMLYRTYFLRNLLAYEYGKIPAPAPDKVAKRALLKLKFSGPDEVGIESTVDSPEAASERHEIIVRGIDEMERQLRKLTKQPRQAPAHDDMCQESAQQSWTH